MRILSVLFSFLVAATLATVTLAYLQQRIGQNRIVVQAGWLAAEEPSGYQAYGPSKP